MRRRQFLAQSLAACAPPVLPAIAEVMGCRLDSSYRLKTARRKPQ